MDNLQNLGQEQQSNNLNSQRQIIKSQFSQFGSGIAMLILASTVLGWVNFFIGAKSIFTQIINNIKQFTTRILSYFISYFDENQNNIDNNNNFNNEIISKYNNDDTCSICLQEIQYKVSVTCYHSFCCECVLHFWEVKKKKQLSCPMCRQNIQMLFKNYEDQDITKNDNQLKNKFALWNNQICHYNFLFAKQKRSLRQMWRDLPFLLQQSTQLFRTTQGIMYMISTACQSHYFILLSLYVISPIDLIPECIFGLLGIIDDLFVIAVLLVIISNFYYSFISQRDQQQYIQNQNNNNNNNEILQEPQLEDSQNIQIQ